MIMKRKRIDADLIIITGIAVSVILAYALLHLRFVKEDVDDAWTLSFIYNMMVRHIDPSVTFGGGLASPHIFGMTQAYVYSFILNIAGWTKNNAHLISTFFMAASALSWYFISRKLDFTVKSAVLFSLMILWCDPFFREANLARPESLTFFIITLSFLLFIYNKPFLSGLLTLIAFENHPMGLFALVFIAAYIVYSGGLKKIKILPAGLFLAGAAAGAVYFLLNHMAYMNEFYAGLKAASATRTYTVLGYYFFQNKVSLHIIIFAFLVLCTAVFLWRKGWKNYPFALYILLLSILVNFINPRDNYHYMLYFYVSLLFTVFVCLEGTKWSRAAPLALFLLVSVHYGYSWLHNGTFDFNKKISMLKSSIPGGTTPVLGTPDDWFAFVGRDFYASTDTHEFDTNAPALYNIEDDTFRNNYNDSGLRGSYNEYLKKNYTSDPVTTFTVNGELYNITLLNKKPVTTK